MSVNQLDPETFQKIERILKEYWFFKNSEISLSLLCCENHDPDYYLVVATWEELTRFAYIALVRFTNVDDWDIPSCEGYHISSKHTKKLLDEMIDYLENAYKLKTNLQLPIHIVEKIYNYIEDKVNLIMLEDL